MRLPMTLLLDDVVPMNELSVGSKVAERITEPLVDGRYVQHTVALAETALFLQPGII
jgi:hypothetical protein